MSAGTWGWLHDDEDIIRQLVYDYDNKEGTWYGNEQGIFHTGKSGYGKLNLWELCLCIGLRVFDKEVNPLPMKTHKGIGVISSVKSWEESGVYDSYKAMASLVGIDEDRMPQCASMGLNYIYEHHYDKSNDYLEIEDMIDVFGFNNETVSCPHCMRHAPKSDAEIKCKTCNTPFNTSEG